MQFLVSLNNSESWQQIVDYCQLTKLDQIDDVNAPHTESLNTTAYCVRSALTLADLTQLLAKKETQIVLSLDAPETVIGKLLQQGKSISDAISIWHQQTVAVLKLQQQHRRQLKLAQANGLLYNPAQAPEWLASMFSIMPDANQRLSHDFHSLMATQALRQNREAETIWQRVIASSLPLLDDPYLRFDLSELHQATIVRKDEQLAEFKDENELLQQQLFLVQEELELQLFKKQTLSKEYQMLEQARHDKMAELMEKLKASEQAVITGKQQLAESKSENEMLLKQLFHIQEELEHYSSKQRQLENDNKHQQTQYKRIQSKLEHRLKVATAEEVNTKHQLAAAQSELKVLSESKLWKSVAPVRKLSQAINAKSRKREKLQQDAALIMTSEYFDINWYLQSYPDVAESGMNPAEHYLCFGADEGRAPGPLFDCNWYLSQYRDVAENGINPLLHYVKFGAQEGRTASPKLLQHQKEQISGK